MSRTPAKSFDEQVDALFQAEVSSALRAKTLRAIDGQRAHARAHAEIAVDHGMTLVRAACAGCGTALDVAVPRFERAEGVTRDVRCSGCRTQAKAESR